MSAKNRQIVCCLIVAIFGCAGTVVQGQMLDQPPCSHGDTTLLDYKMVAGTEYTIVGGKVVWHNLSLDLTNIDLQTIIAVYAKMSGLELVLDSTVKVIHTPISVQADELTQSQRVSLIETALKEQAGIVITRLNDKQAVVTYDSASPVKKPKD